MGFGSDFSGFDDIDPNWTFLEGDDPETLALAQAVARRYITPEGGLFYDGAYGRNIREFLSSPIDPSTAQQMLEAEARKEERVSDCSALITVSGPPNDQLWRVAINCKATNGATFAFTLEVSKVTVKLLTEGI